MIATIICAAYQYLHETFSKEEIARRELIGFGVENPTWEEVYIRIETGKIIDTANGKTLYTPMQSDL